MRKRRGEQVRIKFFSSSIIMIFFIDLRAFRVQLDGTEEIEVRICKRCLEKVGEKDVYDFFLCISTFDS